jgi:hypothetical protein
MSWLGVDDVDNTVRFMPFSRNDTSGNSDEDDDDDLEPPPPIDEIRVDHPGVSSVLLLMSEGDDDDSMLTTTAMISDVVEESLAEITILSSVPSSQVPQEQPHYPTDVDSEDEEDDQLLQQQPPQRSSLSLHASSIDSSISYSYTMATATTTSDVVAAETTTTSLNIPGAALSVASTTTSESDPNTTMLLHHRQAENIPSTPVVTEQQDSRTETASSWMRQFQTEQDWQEWRDSATLLLHAMNCSPDDEQMLAALIAEEEELFWTTNMDHRHAAAVDSPQDVAGGRKRPVSIIMGDKANSACARVLEAVAVLGAVTFASMAVVKIWKGRKE